MFTNKAKTVAQWKGHISANYLNDLDIVSETKRHIGWSGLMHGKKLKCLIPSERLFPIVKIRVLL